ncbi:TPA: hypothetical protein N0F65_001922, partial [Lagenidium giganteum]
MYVSGKNNSGTNQLSVNVAMLGRRLLRANARPLGALDAGVGLRFLSDKKRWKRPARPVLHTTASGDKIPQIRGEPLYGVHSVLQALDCGHREVHGLYVREGRTDAAVPSKGLKGRDDEAIKKIAVLAQERNIPVHPTSKWSLNYVTGDKPHQGVVLDAAPLRLQEFEPQQLELAEHHGRAPVILALDELQDPQNLGAILRSAHFLGCNSILLSERNKLATINSSAPSHGAIYVMLMAIGSIGFALADVAAEELTKELALQYFQEIPNDDGVFYNRVNEFRFVSVLVAFLFMALGMSGLDYGGDFDFTIDYNTLMLICGIVAALPTPLVWLCISEKKRERQSFTACGLHAWALFQNHATNAVIAHRFAAGMLAGISATAVNPIAFYWAEVQPMNDNVVSIMAAVAVIFALSYVKKRGWTINYLKVIVVANAIVLVLDAGATFFTIWGVVRSQYMWIGLPVVEALPSSVGYLISTVIIEEVAEPETIPLLKLVVSAVGFLALSFGLTLTKHINSLFNLSNQNLLRDTTRVRTDASITFAIAYVCQFASIAWICAVPRTADAV